MHMRESQQASLLSPLTLIGRFAGLNAVVSLSDCLLPGKDVRMPSKAKGVTDKLWNN